MFFPFPNHHSVCRALKGKLVFPGITTLSLDSFFGMFLLSLLRPACWEGSDWHEPRASFPQDWDKWKGH